MNLDLVGVGALNADYLYLVADADFLTRLLDGRRRGGEYVLPLTEWRRLREALEAGGCPATRSGGGQAGNTIFAAAKLGLKTGLAACVGDDPEGEYLLQGLAGVDLSHIARRESSGRTLVILDAQGERTIFISPGANMFLSADENNLAYLNQSYYAHFTSFVDTESLAAQAWLAARLAPQVNLSLDPGELYARKGAAPSLQAILSRTRIIFVTAAELELLTGTAGAAGVARLKSRGPKIVVVKFGADGARVYAEDSEIEVPPYPAQVVDTTGAGDVFAAGFLCGLVHHRRLKECGQLAAMTAGLSLSGKGRESYPDRRLLSRSFPWLAE